MNFLDNLLLTSQAYTTENPSLELLEFLLNKHLNEDLDKHFNYQIKMLKNKNISYKDSWVADNKKPIEFERKYSMAHSPT